MQYVPSFTAFVKARGVRTATSIKFIACLVDAVRQGILNKNVVDGAYDCIGAVLVHRAAAYCKRHTVSAPTCMDLIRLFMSYEPDLAYMWVCLSYRYFVQSREFVHILPSIDYLWTHDCSVERFVKNCRNVTVQRHWAALQNTQNERWSACRVAWILAALS
jgi:hypothetical protein